MLFDNWKCVRESGRKPDSFGKITTMSLERRVLRRAGRLLQKGTDKMNNNFNELIGIAHGNGDAVSFCTKAGVDSVRNLDVYFKKLGLQDGHQWSYGELADAYGFSRPRALQICRRTERCIRDLFARCA